MGIPLWGDGRGTGLSVVGMWLQGGLTEPKPERLSRCFFLGYAEIREGDLPGVLQARRRRGRKDAHEEGNPAGLSICSGGLRPRLIARALFGA